MGVLQAGEAVSGCNILILPEDASVLRVLWAAAVGRKWRGLDGFRPEMLDRSGHPYSVKSVVKHGLFPISRLVTRKIAMVQGIGRRMTRYMTT